MKTVFVTAIASLALLSATAQAQYARSPADQLTINAGSGLMFGGSNAVTTYNRHYDNRPGYHNPRPHDRHDRHDRHSHHNDYPRYSRGVTAIITTGNAGLYWSDNRLVSSRYDDRHDYRHDNGHHYGHDRREGNYLKDRYGNCYRIKEGRLNDTRIRVPSSRCRF